MRALDALTIVAVALPGCGKDTSPSPTAEPKPVKTETALEKSADPPRGPAAAAPTTQPAPGHPIDPGVPALEPGEVGELFDMNGDDDDAMAPRLAWRPGGADVVVLRVRVAGELADATEAHLVAEVDGKATEVASFAVNAAYGINARVLAAEDGRLLFEGGHGGGSGDPGHSQFVRLAWNPAARAVLVEESESRSGIDDPPRWAAALR